MKIQLLLIIFTIQFLLLEKAEAYIDPGTTSMILQAVIGGIVGGFVFLKMYWKKLILLFKKDTDLKMDENNDK